MSIITHLERQRYGRSVFKSIDVAYSTLKCIAKEHCTRFVDVNEDENIVPVFASRFCRDQGFQNLLAAANEDGKIVVVDTTVPSSPNFIYSQGHNNAIFDVEWANGGARLLSASGDHLIKMWDVEGELRPSCSFEHHSGSVKTIACRPCDRNIFATGARDGTLVVWDSRIKSAADVVPPDNLISFAHQVRSGHSKGFRPDSITGLAFQDENNLFSSSAGDKVIKAWDIRKTYTLYKKYPTAKYTLPYSGVSSRRGFSDICISPCGKKLYANCVDNFMYVYDLMKYDEAAVSFCRGHSVYSFYIKCCVSPDGKYLASGSSDPRGYIWALDKMPNPLVMLEGHSAEVSCISWSYGRDLKMATCSDDGSFKVWRIFPNCDSPEYDYCIDSVDSAYKGFAIDFTINMIPESLRLLKRKRPVSFLMEKFGCLEGRGENSENLIGCNQICSPVAHTSKRIKTGVLSSIDLKSPTLNLPNYVVDGTSPHHSCDKNLKKRNSDWLTELRKSTPSPGTKSQQPPKRRTSQSGTPRARENLLKFFKKASKQPQSSVCDLVSSPDSDQNRAQSPTPS